MGTLKKDLIDQILKLEKQDSIWKWKDNKKLT